MRCGDGCASQLGCVAVAGVCIFIAAGEGDARNAIQEE